MTSWNLYIGRKRGRALAIRRCTLYFTAVLIATLQPTVIIPGCCIAVTSLSSLWRLNSMDDRPSPSKVAIHRLVRHRKDREVAPERVSMPRVQRACDNCRTRKVRCSGEQPRCQNCAIQSVPCIYSQARKDRLKEFVFQILKFALLIQAVLLRMSIGYLLF